MKKLVLSLFGIQACIAFSLSAEEQCPAAQVTQDNEIAYQVITPQIEPLNQPKMPSGKGQPLNTRMSTLQSMATTAERKAYLNSMTPAERKETISTYKQKYGVHPLEEKP